MPSSRTALDMPGVWWWLLLMFAGAARGFNVDTGSAVFHGGEPGSMFGFSVALYRDGSRNGLLVGAPKAQTSQPNVTNGGAVYLCGTEPTSYCQLIPFDTTGSNSKLVSNRRQYTDDKSYQWFGASVTTSLEKGLAVACAPRYVYFSINYQRREPVGNCWIARDSLKTFEEYSPCRTASWGFHRQGFCQAGFSAALTKDGSRLYVGAPGSWYWQGQVFSHDMVSSSEDKKSKESPVAYDDSFLGYSSAVGDFNGDGEMDVVAGMPRGNNLTGKVVLFDSRARNLQNVSGDQMGSYFGYSVAVSDVNGDGRDDIIVGAPLFTDLDSKERKYEEGRVYVHYQDQYHHFDPSANRATLDGAFVKGRFGLALAGLKDINVDGFGDFAVGAPYAGKDGSGIVYIYHGSSKGVREKPSQVITAADFKDKSLKTLGFALSGAVDMDSNEYPDIVIGAYDSEKVIFMRSRPVVNMTSSMVLSKEVISLEDKTCTLKDKTKVACVDAKLCLTYFGVGVAPEIDITYHFVLDGGQKGSRALFLDADPLLVSNRSLTLRLKKGVEHCNTSKIYVQNGIRDKLTPIEVSAAYELIDLEPYRFTLKPILNMDEPTAATNHLNIEKNCGKDDVCIPDLQLYAKSNMEQYSIGTKQRLELDVTVNNAGEGAFESMLYVTTPPDVNYVNIDRSKLDFPVSCSPKLAALHSDGTDVTVLVCDVGNPLPANKTLEFKIIFEPSRIISSTSDLVFSMVVNSTNPEKNETTFNNLYEIDLPVRVEVSLAVRGISLPEVITYNKSEELPESIVYETDVGPEVMHVYEVGNQGPSSIQQAEVYLLWPAYTLEGKSLLYPMAQPDIAGNAVCERMAEVNPLKLEEVRRKPRDQNITSQDLTQHFLFHSLRTKSSASARQNELDQGPDPQKRSRRNDPEDEVLLADEGVEKYFSDQGEDEFLEELSCEESLCSRIRCIISNLEKGDQVIFRVRSRLWRETYNEMGLSDVKTSSKLIARITALPYGVDPSYLPYKIFVVSTTVSLLDVPLPSEMIPWWIIIVAVCCGLLLLALIVLLCWKLGFFKRKRPQEMPEKEPLNERNGYRMGSGDTAL